MHKFYQNGNTTNEGENKKKGGCLMKIELFNGFKLYLKGGLKNGNVFPMPRPILFTYFLGELVLDVWENGNIEVCKMPF